MLLQSTLSGDGIEGYYALKDEYPPSAFRPELLDSYGWQVNRRGAKALAHRIFELNFNEHAKSFSTTESLAYRCAETGDRQRAQRLIND